MGCSNNISANTTDLDLALEQSRRREQDFNDFVNKEMNKLNLKKLSTNENFSKDLVSEVLQIEESQTDLLLTPKPDTNFVTKTEEFTSDNKNATKLCDYQAVAKVKNNQTIIKIRAKASTPGITSKRVTQAFLTRLSTPATNYFRIPKLPKTLYENFKVEKLLSDCQEFKKNMKNIKNLKSIEENENSLGKIALDEYLTGKKHKRNNYSDDNYMDDQVLLDLKIAKNSKRNKKV